MEARRRQTRPALGAVVVACVVVSALLRSLAGRQMKRHSRCLGGGRRLARSRLGWRRWRSVHPVHSPALRSHQRRLCQRVLRLDGALRVRGADDHVLARDPGCHRAARAARTRRPRSTETLPKPTGLIAPGLDAAVFFWSYLAGIGVVTWVTLVLGLAARGVLCHAGLLGLVVRSAARARDRPRDPLLVRQQAHVTPPHARPPSAACATSVSTWAWRIPDRPGLATWSASASSSSGRTWSSTSCCSSWRRH